MDKNKLNSITTMTHTHFITRAAEIAREAHAGQTDKAGKDYFEGHLTSVASMGKTWQQQVVGYLHDVAEDTPTTEVEIIQLLQTEEKLSAQDAAAIGEALRLLNNKHFTDRESYLQAIKKNDLARAVKINDLTNNMDLKRIANPNQKDWARLQRYEQELAWITKD